MVAVFKPRFSSPDRLPPQNIELEIKILGGILLDPNAMCRVAPILPSPEAFSLTYHQHIYRTALSMFEKGEAIDPNTMLTALRDRRLLELVGGGISGQSRLANLIDNTVSTANIDRYAELLLRDWKRRQLELIGSEAADFAHDLERSPEAAAQILREKLDSLVALDSPPRAKQLQAEIGKLADRIKRGEIEESEAEAELQILQEELNSLVADDIAIDAPLTAKELRSKIDKLAAKIERGDIKESEVESELQNLANRARRQPRDVREQLAKRQAERELESDRAELMSCTLPSLMQVRRQKLNISELLHGDGGELARQLTQTALSMPTAPEWLFTTLIPAAGSRMGAARVIVSVAAKYFQPAIFRSIIVGSTGHKKTPAQKAVLEALENLEGEEFERFQREGAFYEAACKSTPKGMPQPDAPEPRRRFVVTDATIEALVRIHSENPRGFLVYRDEASAFIAARNKYRNGKGDDAEQELSEFNGGMLSKDRTKESLFIARTAISRTGGTQWETLQALMANHEDTTGEWARWLFCAAECPPSYINLSSDSDRDFGLTDSLRRLYQRLDCIEPADYLLSRDAKNIFERKQHQLIDWSRQEDCPGLKASFPKFESYLGRLALWLHLVNAALANEPPEPTINGQTMRLAAYLLDYFIGQLRLIYAQNAPQQELSGILLKIQAYAENKGCPVALRQFKNGIFALRKLPIAEIKEHCESLANAGYGQIEGNRYLAFSQSHPPNNHGPSGGGGHSPTPSPNGPNSSPTAEVVDLVDGLLIRDQHPQHLENQRVERFVDVVDLNVDGFRISSPSSDSENSLEDRINNINNDAEMPAPSRVDGINNGSTTDQQDQQQAQQQPQPEEMAQPEEGDRELIELSEGELDFLIEQLQQAAQSGNIENLKVLRDGFAPASLKPATVKLFHLDLPAFDIVMAWLAELNAADKVAAAEIDAAPQVVEEPAAPAVEPADTSRADTEVAAANIEPAATAENVAGSSAAAVRTPILSADEIQLLAIACQYLSPDKKARVDLLAAVREVGQSVELAGEPVEAPTEKSGESIFIEPGLPISICERNTKRALELLTKAQTFKAIAGAIKESRNLLPWLSANQLDKGARRRIWEIIRGWLDSKLHPQMVLGF